MNVFKKRDHYIVYLRSYFHDKAANCSGLGIIVVVFNATFNNI
jgi:hypothetical protein